MTQSPYRQGEETGAGDGVNNDIGAGAGDGVYNDIGAGDGVCNDIGAGVGVYNDIGAGANATLIGEVVGANVAGNTGAYDGVMNEENGTFETTVPPFLFLTVQVVEPLIIDVMSLFPIIAILQSISFVFVFMIGFKSKGVYGSFCT